MKTKIVVIGTGGTIAAQQAEISTSNYSSPSLSLENLINPIKKYLPSVDFQCLQFSQKISHVLDLNDLIALGKLVQEELNKEITGVVVVHGTNALEELAYFLNLVVKTNKPIVITGAMKPNSFLGSDGTRNLYNAINIAKSSSACNKGALVTFNDKIIAARFVEKNSLTIVDGIAQKEIGILGYVQGDAPYFYVAPTYLHTMNSQFNIMDLDKLIDVGIIYAHLSAKKEIVNSLIAEKIKGLISVGFGKGYQTPEINKALLSAADAGILIVRVSRSWGRDPTPIEEINDSKNFIAGNNLSPQKAMILLSLALTITNCPTKIQRFFDEH